MKVILLFGLLLLAEKDKRMRLYDEQRFFDEALVQKEKLIFYNELVNCLKKRTSFSLNNRRSFI
jgi:hypothetical protein